MSTQDDLQQQLFEFIYDLLPEDEAAQLNERITSEPDVARAYAKAKQQTEMLATAAQLHGPPVKLERPRQEEPLAGKASAGSVDTPAPLKWLIGLAATALVCVTGYYGLSPTSAVNDRQTANLREQVAAEHLRMVVTAPAQLSAGAPGSFSVATSSIDRRPVAAKVKYALYSPETGEPLHRGEAETGDDGRALISLPPDSLIADARLEIEAARGEDAVRMTTRVQVEDIRYATQLTTDKPLYRPGETIRYRSLTLTRFGLASDRELPVAFQLLDPAGGTVAGSEQTGYTRHGVAGGQFTIPPHFSGGTYTLVVQSAAQEPEFPEERRDVFVRKYRLPRLKKELEFTRDSYAPGDEVTADFLAERAEGGAAAGAQLTISATVDGQVVFGDSPQANADGTCRIEFTLPKEIERGEGTLAVVVDDGGNRETIAKTIPINLGKVEVEFYPEGGDLVPGVKNRVYFYGHDPLGEPVDIRKGRIVDSEGREVARTSTYHEGRGVFSFTPAAGEEYRLEVLDPADVQVNGALPEVAARRDVTINTGAGVFPAGEPVSLDILSTKADVPLVITAVCRGTQVAQQEFQTSEVHSVNAKDAAKSRVKFHLPPEVSGVIRLTVFDYSQSPPRPLTERLVYRRPERKLTISVVRDGSAEASPSHAYAPGEHVALSLRVADERGRPRPAALGVSVVDDALLNLADDKSPTLPTYYYLASEIEHPEDLEDANFYLLEGRHRDKSPSKALDLLLGTQGWRRFVQWDQVQGGERVADADGASGLPEMDAPDDHADDADDADDAGENDEIALEDTVDGGANAAAGEDEEHAEDHAAAVERLVAMEGTENYPTLYDNLPEIEPKFEAAVAEQYNRREAAIAGAGYISFFGGVVILVLVAMLAILRLADDRRFWLPVSAAALACLIAGGFWMSTEVDDEGKTVVTGFAGFDATSVALLGENETGPSPADATAARETAMPAPEDDLARPPDEATNEAAPMPQGEPIEEPEIVAEDAEMAADMPAREPPGDPPEFAEEERVNFDDDLDGLADKEITGRFDALGPIGNDLKKLHGGRWWYAEGSEELGQGFGYYARDEKVWFDGTVADVARMRKLLQQAMKRGDEKATMTIAEAYEKLLAKYQLPVRQYAHQHIQGEPGVRSDFTETLFWHPLLITDEQGVATIEFDLSDAVTTFVVKANAHAVNAGGAGRIGAVERDIVSRIPFSLEPKLPLEVNAGDRIELPLAVNNDTQREMPVRVAFSQTGGLLKLDGESTRQMPLAPGQRHREHFTLDVVGQRGAAELRFAGTAGDLSDAVSRRLTVVPPGFPVSKSYSGRLDGEKTVQLRLPDDWVEGSLAVTLTAFPSTLADLQKGMEGMLRDPNGCFEQASSSNYPNVLALRYMEEHGVADPNFTRRAKGLLERGYDKLVSFECKEPDAGEKAFEWFGGWPAHEALTAYGILEFKDMSRVYDVDQAMIRRATQWLLDRRDGEGGFQRNPRALDSFGGAPQDITNAYIVWALTEAGEEELTSELAKEIDHAITTAEQSDDPYILALAAASAHNARRKDDAARLMRKLVEHQQDDGSLEAQKTSITRSGGRSLTIETTALAALAWLKDPAMADHATRAVQWITDQRQGSGSFGATQSTILALKALVEHAKANKKTVAAGEWIVRRDGEEIAKTAFAAGETQAIEIVGLAAQLQPGENDLTLVLTGDNQMPYALDVRYRARTPVSSDECPVRIATKLTGERLDAGQTTQLNVRLENTSGQGQPMTVAIVGLPAGLEPRVEHLDELQEAGEFDFYELNAREIVFYWRGVAPEARGAAAIDFNVDVVAEIPGRYTGPASRAYLYYTAEQKHWVEPLAVEIAPQ